MEFPFSVNELLPDAITVVDEKLAPFRSKVISDRYELGHKQQQLKQVIDAMGEASGRAQNLRGAITSAMKLQCSDHKLYVMKDGAANCGKGAVVGILKTGYKKLFLLDLRQVQNEVNPLCVLDFYVHESKQRMGYGKSLFQHMLKVENVHPAQVAIDRPSVKFISFLKKHYDLKNVIPQVNNFVVFDEFFRNLQAVSHVSKGGQRLTGGGPGGNHGRPPIHPYRRNSQQGSDHRWGGRTQPTRDNSRLSSARPGSREVYVLAKSTPGMPPQSSDEALKNIALPPLVSRTPSLHSRPGSQEAVSGRRRNSLTELVNTECIVDRGMAARATCYSRHSLSRGNSAPNKIRAKQTTSDVMDISLNGPVPGSSSLLAISSENSGGNITPESTSTVEILRGTGSGRTFSGGRRRNLHLTSSDNTLGVGPISTQYRFPNTRENKIEQADTNSKNASSSADTTQNHDYMSPSGNYSINSVYNAHFGPEKGTGLSTSWNVLGVPSYVGQQTPKHPYYTQNKPQPRTFPF